MIEIKNIKMTFGKKAVLNNINLLFEPGIYGLMGPNGAGKTTLMRCIVGLLKPRDGKIELNENYIGYLPQHYGAFKDFTCFEMLDYYSTYRKQNIKREEIEEVLKDVHLLQEKDKKIKNLSGGMLRRLGIAQAILGNPSIIVLDEPLVGLDPEERMHMKEVLKKYSEEKIIIISSHIVNDIENMCNKFIIMNNGIIAFNGTKNELLLTAEAMKKTKINTIEEGYLCIIGNI